MVLDPLKKQKDPLKQLENVSTEMLKKIGVQKQRYADAPNYQEQHFASMEGDKLRAEAGVEAGSEGLLSLPELNKMIADREAKAQPVAPTIDTLKSGMAEEQKQIKMRNLKNAFDSVVRSSEAQRAQLNPLFNKATGQVRTEGTLAKEGARKVAAVGATGAGSLSQSDIAQNVITGGQMNTLREQRNTMENNINARIADAQAKRDQGIADAESEANIQQMQLELQQLESQAAAELKQQEINDARDFEVYKKQLDFENETTLKLLDNELKQENIQLEAEIDNAMANNDFERARMLEGVKSQNNIKLQAIRNSGAMQQIAAKNQAAQQQILLKDELGGAKEEAEAAEGGFVLEAKKIISSIDNEISRAVEQASNKQSLSDKEAGIGPVSVDEKRQLALEAIVANPQWFGDDPAKVMEVASEYGLSAEEIVEYEEYRERALQDRPFE